MAGKAKKADEFVLGVGPAEKLQTACRRNGCGSEVIEWLCTGENLVQVERLRLGLLPTSFKILVDYSMTLDEMIAAGKYDWKNDGIVKNFRVEGKGKQEVTTELIYFNRTMSSDSVLKELDKRGFRPAILAELLAFGAQNPEVQRQFPVVALGSAAMVGGDRRVACVGRHASDRSLDLDWFDGVWDGYDRFLAVRK